MTEKQLALWMLDRMQNSEKFLAEIRAARTKGKHDILDDPEIVGKHRRRMKKLFQSDDEESVDVPADVAGALAAIEDRDALSSPEELIEKMIGAYIAQHPEGATGLPQEWQTTLDLARAEIEGRVTGAFREGFVADLAEAAHTEMDRQADAERGRDNEPGGREG